MNYTVQIKTSAQAARLLRDHLDDLDHEELWGIYLTGCGYLINAEMLTKGTLTCTPIDARTVIKRALMNNAAAVIIVHNHPSGNPRPSVSDITQTDHIRKACNLMDIALVDHLILTRDVYFSFNDEVTKNYQPIKNQ